MSRLGIVFVFILAIVAKHQVNSVVGTIGDVATISNFVNDALAFVNGDLPLENLIMGSTGYALDTIIGKMGELSSTLEQMETNNERRMNYMLETLMNRLPLEQRVEIGLTELHHLIVRIDAMYQDYEDYSKNPGGFDQSTIMDFISSVTSHKAGDLQDILDNMHRLMMPARSANYRKPLQDLVHQKNLLMSFGELCGTGTSPQQRLFEIYYTVLISESRAYLMNIFSYAMLIMYRNTTFASEMRKVSTELLTRTGEYLIATNRAMENSSLAIDQCDPEKFERGENFVELQGAIQMFVINEFHVTSNLQSPCSGSCEAVNSGVIRSDSCSNNKNYWCPKKPCSGRTFDCISGGSSSVCELPLSSMKRYAWVIDTKKNSYGNSASCPAHIKHPSYSGSCDICICTCALDSGDSSATRTISLRPQLSNIDANMVITGVKFISSDKLIQIQIQEGELLPGGRINNDNEQWIDPERFEYDPSQGLKGRRVGSFFTGQGENRKLLRHSKDFAFVTYYQRTMNLDDLKAPLGYVVTGVKFQHENNETAGDTRRPMQLAIHITKFDFDTGVLDADSSYWMSHENMPNLPEDYGHNRKYVDISEPDDPTKVKGHTVVSEPGKCVLFMTSDRKKDAGQATIPFFDAQPVISSITFPLSGLGLVHRGAPGSGGFLAFRLLTLDLPKYLKTVVTPDMIAAINPKISG